MDFAGKPALWSTRQPPQGAAVAAPSSPVASPERPRPETNLHLRDWSKVDFVTYIPLPDILYCDPPPFLFCKHQWTTIEDVKHTHLIELQIVVNIFLVSYFAYF